MASFSNNPLANVSFNGPGVEAVFRYLMQDPILATDARRTRCMAFAYFVAGVHMNGTNAPRDRLHPMYRAFKDKVDPKVQTQIRREFTEFINDFHATWDFMSGGATVCTHTNGTRRPNTDIDNNHNEVTVDLYATKVILDEIPSAPFSVARMSQEFIEGIVMDTIRRWDRLTNKLGWAEDGPAPDPRPLPISLLPPSRTSYFSIQGRTPGTLEPLIQQYLATRAPYTWSVYAPPPRLPAVFTAPPAPATPLQPSAPAAPSAPVAPAHASAPATPSQPPAPASSPAPAARAEGEVTPTGSVRVVMPPSGKQLSTRKAEKSRAVRTPSPDPFDDDWDEAMRMHSLESLDYLDKIDVLNTKIENLHLLNHSQQLEINQLKEENVALITEVTRLRLQNVVMPVLSGEPSTSGIPLVSTPAPRQAEDYRPVSPSPSVVSSVSSVSTSLRSQALTRAGSTISPNVTMEGGVPFRMVGPAHQRIGAFGDATRRVFAQYDIPNSAHFLLWTIERSYIDEDWPTAVQQFLDISDDAVLAAIVDAMIADSTPEA